MENVSGALALRPMSKASLDSCGDCFSRHSPADSNLVTSHVAYLQSEEWHERIGFAADIRAGELPQRLADVAQTAKGHSLEVVILCIEIIGFLFLFPYF